MQIRKIKPFHKDMLIALSKQNFKDESWSNEQLENAIEDDNYICIALLDDDDMLSYLIAVQTLDDINILSIATKKECQKNGYATMLIKWMVNLCRQVDKTLSLEVKSKNSVAINLYTNIGFKKIHERKNYYRDGDTALIMFYDFTDKEHLS